MTKPDSHDLQVLFGMGDGSWTMLFDGVRDGMVVMEETMCTVDEMVHIEEMLDQLCSWHVLKMIFHCWA